MLSGYRLTSKQTEEWKRPLQGECGAEAHQSDILRLASAFFSPRSPTRPAQVVTFVETHRDTFGVAPLLGMDLACAELERQGMQVLERNWRCRLGEPNMRA